jgi:hypothetical protein
MFAHLMVGYFCMFLTKIPLTFPLFGIVSVIILFRSGFEQADGIVAEKFDDSLLHVRTHLNP